MKKFAIIYAMVVFGDFAAFAGSSCGHACHPGHAGCNGYELGVAVGYAHLKGEGESEDAPVLHLHVSKRLGSEDWRRYFSFGVGGEAIFAEHEHYALGFPLAVYPWRGLVMAVAPGIEWVKHEDVWESHYATHFEAAYVFEMGRFDVGPVVEYSKSHHHEHTVFGLHVGFHF